MSSIDSEIRIMGDILHCAGSGTYTDDEIAFSITHKSRIKKSEILSFIRLLLRFGLLTESGKKLNVTKPGREFLKYVNQMSNSVPVDGFLLDESALVFTLPPFFINVPLDVKNNSYETTETIRQIIEDCENLLYICSPFIDVSILQMCFQNIGRKNASICLITSDPSLVKEYKNNKNFKLEELKKFLQSRFSKIEICYIITQMTISHAKIWCSEKSMLVTSANVKKDSFTENFEAGLYTERQDLIRTMRNLLHHVSKNHATKIDLDE